MLDFKSVTPNVNRGSIIKKVLRFPKVPKVRFPKLSLRYKILTAIFLIGVVATAAIYFSPVRFNQFNSLPRVAQANGEAENVQVLINKEMRLPIYAENGDKTENELKITAVNIERTDKILVNGKPASAKVGKDFLIINLEIKNDTTDKLNVRPVDFFRLVVSADKSYAADVHNDVVKAEPLSIRKSRVGWVVDEKQHTFKFTIGEINGEKQTIEVNI